VCGLPQRSSTVLCRSTRWGSTSAHGKGRLPGDGVSKANLEICRLFNIENRNRKLIYMRLSVQGRNTFCTPIAPTGRCIKSYIATFMYDQGQCRGQGRVKQDNWLDSVGSAPRLSFSGRWYSHIDPPLHGGSDLASAPGSTNLPHFLSKSCRVNHISDALVSLHWLRVPECIEYNILVYKVLQLHGLAPRYLGPLSHVADLPSRRALRSASTNRLHIPPVRLSTVGTQSPKPSRLPDLASGTIYLRTSHLLKLYIHSVTG